MWSCRRALARRPAQPNVLLITLDTTRADRLGSYGYAAAATPHLDRLAAAGVRFAQAVSPAPLTLPAHASLITGRNPFAHGVRNNGYFVLPADVPTLAERFAGRRLRHRRLRQLVRARPPVRPGPRLRALRRRARSAGRGGRLAGARASRRPHRGGGRGLAGRPAPRAAVAALFPVGAPLRRPRSLRPPAPFVARFGRPALRRRDCVPGRAGRRAARRAPATAARPRRWWSWPATTARAWASTARARTGCSSTRRRCACRCIVSWPGVLAAGVVRDAGVSLVDVAPTVTALAGLAPLEGGDGRSLRAAHRWRRR